eukprot:TRINITY_DN4565_c0_g3_i1.p1 TRINITY_DN4565_c0_g3~~TRINITY_DN4565_c0_g3_i1.p1  ORF type:complete len:649 (+),score=147.30 TRINITY_DN4565_c0_g3_i1:181-2127(+)
MAITSIAESSFRFALSVAYSLRIELGFIIVFSFLWFAGRLLGASLVAGKGELSKGHGKHKESPAIPRRTPQQLPCKTSTTSTSAHNGANISATLEFLSSNTAISSIDAALLQDPSWLIPQVCNLCRAHAQRAMELYRHALKSGLNLKEVAKDDCMQLFTTLVTSAIRIGQADEALNFIKELHRDGPGLTGALVTSATKLCTAKQLFAECLAIHDFATCDAKVEIEDKAVWSCLLFCAVEKKAWARCSHFFDRLRAFGEPSGKDFGNMVRFASSTGDWHRAVQIVEDMRKLKIEIDSVVYNTVLSALVTAGKIDKAREILDQMLFLGDAADVITYNTLSKGYVKAGRMNDCFELCKQMRERGIKPSQVTYGIMLDGCINDNQLDRAAEVFETMKKEGCTMNTVLYTTLIKGFSRAGEVNKATEIYEQMRKERCVPDVITFSILIKAHCDARQLQAALQLFAAMKDLRLRADEVVFNHLLGGCVEEGNAELAKRLYAEMISAQIKPSSATFSILIRLYAQCKMLDEAVELLKKEPAERGVLPEARLYSQLAQCCLRDRQGRRSVEVYKMLLEHSSPTVAVHGSILGMCTKLNMLDTGVEILSLASLAGGRVDARDANALMQAARKKKKTALIESITTAMEQLKIPISGAS